LNFENRKFFKWWIQSYLVDIQNIQIGLRDDNGIVNKIVECRNSSIYEKASRRSNDRMCFNFLNGLLKVVQRFCYEEGELYLAKRTVQSESVQIRKVNKCAEREFYQKNYFLHDWFKSSI
jgi:hypothetical protein